MKNDFSICFVCPEAYPVLKRSDHAMAGGAELQQALLAKEFAKRGHDVSFVAGDYGQPAVEYVDGVRVMRSYKVGYGNRKLRFLPDCCKIYKAMKVADADIYFQRCVFHHTGKVALFAKLLGKRFVFSSGADFNTNPRVTSLKMNPLYKYSYLWAIKHADLILCQNNFQEKAFINNYKRESFIVPNITARPDESKKLCKNNTKDVSVLWVGSYSANKQPRKVVEIADILPNYKFWMISKPLDPVVEKGFKKVNFPQNLELLGFVPQHKISAYFSSADIFISTSTYEGFPNTFLQAMNHGLPIISLNVNPDNVLEKSGCGICCDGDFARMISELAGLLKNEEKMARMGEKGKEYVMKFHSPNVVIPMYEELFRKL